MADNAWLDAHDRPGGPSSPVDQNALSIGWLQAAIDRFHREFPVTATVVEASIVIPTTGLVTLPADYIIDMRNGVVIPGRYQLLRWPLQRFVQATISNVSPGEPTVYAIHGATLRVLPTPAEATNAKLWYYAMPGVLDANDVPAFPDEYTLVDYLRLRALEHSRQVQVGAAQSYLNTQCAKLRAEGLGGEAEDASINLDPSHFRPGPLSLTDASWMGTTVPR